MFHFDDYFGLHEPVSCTKICANNIQLGFGYARSASYVFIYKYLQNAVTDYITY